MNRKNNLDMKGAMVNRTDKEAMAAEAPVEAVQPADAAAYADNLATQLRKGFMAYCVLVVCAAQAHYTGDIIRALRQADMVVVEGTIYPLLSRLQKDGLLEYDWRESEQGPPRKYYATTAFGQAVAAQLKQQMKTLSSQKK